jgi:hypothetical protein
MDIPLCDLASLAIKFKPNEVVSECEGCFASCTASHERVENDPTTSYAGRLDTLDWQI